MKLSEISFTHIEPAKVAGNQDGYHIVSQQWQLNDLVEKYGDLEVAVEYDLWGRPSYSILALEAERKAYVESKMAACSDWGCE